MTYPGLDIIALGVAVIYLLAFVNVFFAIQSSRTPQGATAWSIALISLPFLALPLYWIFGRSKFHGYVEAHRQVEGQVRQRVEEVLQAISAHAAVPPPGLESLFKLVGDRTRLPFTTGNTVELLVDGEKTFPAILDAIRSATDYVLIQFYIYRDDDIGTRIADALGERARDGVRVYFIVHEIDPHARAGFRRRQALFSVFGL